MATAAASGISWSSSSSSLTICVGDIHGHASKLFQLWRNLEARVGPSSFESATVVFLGDYCDRGPDTSKVLDFLISLPSRFPSQKHVFLCGNHDFAFAAFLKVLPSRPPPPGFSFTQTWDEFKNSEQREGWWTGDGQDDIHVQGRRWAGNIQEKFNPKTGMNYKGSTYDAATTFSSYGLKHGDAGLLDSVPSSHKKFLQDLVWIYEQDVVEAGDLGPCCSNLIAVHAGLEKSKPIEHQLKVLHERDVTLPRIESLSGRKNVWDTPLDLAEKRTLLVSGHHGVLHVDKFRLIIDEGGGIEHRPIAAIILPSRIIVRDTDDPQSSTSIATNLAHCE